MKKGFLSNYFRGVAAKKLAPVDTMNSGSNQHEVNGSRVLAELLGTSPRKKGKNEPDNRYPARYIWIGGENETLSEDGKLSWYDSRANATHRSAEWRLYYTSNSITDLMRPGDTLFIAVAQSSEVFFIVTPGGSTVEHQLFWLFGIPSTLTNQFSVFEIERENDAELDFAARYILEELGLDLSDADESRFDSLLERYGTTFPPTRELSSLARRTLDQLDPVAQPDKTLLAWLEREELLFRRLERVVVQERLNAGFADHTGANIEGFLRFSLSVQNRRKSRMGHSLENHLEKLLQMNEVKFERGVTTENRARPDFLFPSSEAYHDLGFPDSKLKMLGAKSTCKDRWRQVLSEANRISKKHLLTLEPGISEFQTAEMQAHHLQLVVPSPIHESYTSSQRDWLYSVADFVKEAKAIQV